MTDEIHKPMNETAEEKALRADRARAHKRWIRRRIKDGEQVNTHDRIYAKGKD